MLNLPKPLMRMCVVAGLVVCAAISNALPLDGQISINKALSSPTLTVRYTSANAALIEMRVNGQSVGTRGMTASKSSGETSFDLNLASLHSGENEIEVILYDKNGKQIGSEKTTITADQNEGPIFLSSPKMGSTVQGNLEIKVGFGTELKNSYVSFFIDNQFKSISNVAPYSFLWDTQKESNGWHEVEAWVVDENSTTFKTRKVRVFIDNPRGRTERRLGDGTTPMTSPAGTKLDPVKVAPVKAATKPPNYVGTEMDNTVAMKISGATLTKPAQTSDSVATGPQMMTPTGKRHTAPVAMAQKGITSVASAVTGAASLVSVTKGKRLPNIGTYSIVFNTEVVSFDVQPRVENGVPLTPFRHLVEKAGGKVDWMSSQKNVSAMADGREIFFHIGDSSARIDKMTVELEQRAFIEAGRAIVPLSFMRDALNVNIDYDKATNHVLITSATAKK